MQRVYGMLNMFINIVSDRLLPRKFKRDTIS